MSDPGRGARSRLPWEAPDPSENGAAAPASPPPPPRVGVAGAVRVPARDLPAHQGPGPPPPDRAAQPVQPGQADPRSGGRSDPQGGLRPALAGVGSAQLRRAGGAGHPGPRRDLRPGTAGAADPGPDGLRHPGQHLQAGLHRARRQAGAHRRPLPGRPPPAPGHRPDRLRGGPPDRRQLAHGGRPPARRQPRQRHHQAAGAGRPPPLDPKVQARRAQRGGPAAHRQRSPSRCSSCSRRS